MDFFDKLGKKASEAYKVTAEKTSKLTKEAKLKMKNSENKSAIDDLYKEIGKKVYQKYISKENIDIRKELEEECTKIDVLAAEIEANLNECLELKDKVKCEKCSTLVDKNFNFCPECGAKMENAEVVKENEKENVQKAKDVEILEDENELKKKEDKE